VFIQLLAIIKKITQNLKIPSINYHLWEPCNMKCKFCFATFQDVKSTVLPKGHLSKNDSLKVIDEIIKAGYSKITFAGGEPTLCPWIDELIIKAKKGGVTTMLVTNGARLSKKILNKVEDYLDWVTLSIDSINKETLIETGRMERKQPMSENEYLKIINNIHSKNIRLKLNTVVTSQNYNENLSQFVLQMKPERWKIMQVLPIKGQNDNAIDNFLIDQKQFQNYIINNSSVTKSGIKVIPENNDEMTESYVMIDPAGRFFDNANGIHNYSKPILEVGIKKAFKEVNVKIEKFINRSGIYNWEK